MRIIAFTMGYWNNEGHAKDQAHGMFGLIEWHKRVVRFLDPMGLFIACGTVSNPDFNPLNDRGVLTVNSGQKDVGGYDVYYNQYSLCAWMAAMAYACNRQDWDLLCILDTDCLVGAVDFDLLFREFMEREELMLSPQWFDRPGGPFYAFKPDGAAWYLHRRLRANMIASGGQEPMLQENEMATIFGNKWWNPWPDIQSMRQDYPQRQPADPRECLVWPFVRFPHPSIIEEYLATQTVKAKPFK